MLRRGFLSVLWALPFLRPRKQAEPLQVAMSPCVTVGREDRLVIVQKSMHATVKGKPQHVADFVAAFHARLSPVPVKNRVRAAYHAVGRADLWIADGQADALEATAEEFGHCPVMLLEHREPVNGMRTSRLRIYIPDAV